MKPMLAKPFKDSWVKFPVYIQPKLDGMRALWTGEKLLSRTGKSIEGVPTLVEYLEKHYKDFPLDGELYNHQKTFQEQISSIRRTVNIEEDLSIEYHIYDLPIAHHTFQERHKLLKEKVKETSRIKIVKTIRILKIKVMELPKEVNSITECNLDELVEKPISEEEFSRYMNDFIEQGYEGAMLRNSTGVYTFGKRSSDLMKLKTFQDAEFPIIGTYQLVRHEKIVTDEWVPGARQKSNGQWSKDGEGTPDEMIGGLTLQLSDGRTFECGSGYTEEQRREMWINNPTGKLATIKFQELTDDGIPRFPVFIAIRDYE
jgi:ATP-dependent DNA ligase